MNRPRSPRSVAPAFRGDSTWDKRWSTTTKVAHEATTSTASQPKSATSAQRNSQADPAAVFDTSRVSELLWNRSDPRRFEADMANKFNLKTLTCQADAKKKLNGQDPTVFGLYRIAGVDWLLAEEEQFSSITTLRLVDLKGLPRDNTMGPLSTRSLTDIRHQVRQRVSPNRKGNFLVENKPNNRHQKIYRQFAKPRGQSADEFSKDYPRVSSVEVDEKRYAHLELPEGASLFAAYEPQDMKLGEFLIVAISTGCGLPHSS